MSRARRAVAVLLLAAAPGFAVDRAGDLERLRAAIAESRERVARYEREERGLLDALEAIERSAELLERDVELARERAESARAELARAEANASDLEVRLARTERAMRGRAIALYRAGELGAVPMLFSAGDLREFLGRIQTLRRLLRHDAELLARHRAESRELAALRVRAARAAEERERARAALAERSGQLLEEREQKRALAVRLKGSRSRERSALSELETASRALEEMVGSLPAGGAGAAPMPAGPPFRGLRGRLPRPVDGSVGRRFGREVDPEFRTETFRKGVEFEVPSGTPVRAVASGRVRLAGRFRGYGKLVIVDHGDRYFTVFAHLLHIDVEAGDAVHAGEAIGLVGDSGSLSGAHLYFEVRRGAQPLDPHEWLEGSVR